MKVLAQNSLVKIFFLFSVLIALQGCQNEKRKVESSKIVKTGSLLRDGTNIDTLLVEKPPKRTFPKLTKENAMEFFLQYERENKENKVRIATDFGAIELLLFGETKYHRANFIFLAKQKYFDGTQFYRVINGFMIQGGNSDDRKIAQKRSEIGKYLLPPDTKRGFKHHRGVISMPSSEIDNPYKLASPYEFFIVQQREGAHHLDGGYTIFGKVTKGMEVVDKIAAVETDESDWPLRNVYIRKVEIID